MPKSELPTQRIAVTQRPGDGRWFAGDVEVTIEQSRRRGPWRLSLQAALGLVEQSTQQIAAIGDAWPATGTSRRDGAVRLHRCRGCRSLRAWVETPRLPPRLTKALRSRGVRPATCHVCGAMFPAQRSSKASASAKPKGSFSSGQHNSIE